MNPHRRAQRPAQLDARPWKLLSLMPLAGALLLGGCAASGRADFDLAARLRFSGSPGPHDLAWAPGQDWNDGSLQAWALGPLAGGQVASANGR